MIEKTYQVRIIFLRLSYEHVRCFDLLKRNMMIPSTFEPRATLLSLIESLKADVEASAEGDIGAHARVLDGINALQLAAETPLETIYRIGHNVRLTNLGLSYFDPALTKNQHWQAACIRTALDLGIFDAIVEAGELGIDNESLSHKIGADDQFTRS